MSGTRSIRDIRFSAEELARQREAEQARRLHEELLPALRQRASAAVCERGLDEGELSDRLAQIASAQTEADVVSIGWGRDVGTLDVSNGTLTVPSETPLDADRDVLAVRLDVARRAAGGDAQLLSVCDEAGALLEAGSSSLVPEAVRFVAAAEARLDDLRVQGRLQAAVTEKLAAVLADQGLNVELVDMVGTSATGVRATRADGVEVVHAVALRDDSTAVSQSSRVVAHDDAVAPTHPEAKSLCHVSEAVTAELDAATAADAKFEVSEVSAEVSVRGETMPSRIAGGPPSATKRAAHQRRRRARGT